MVRPDVITIDLLDLLREMQLSGQDEGLTVYEIADALKMSTTWVRQCLRRLHHEGKLDIGFRMGSRIDGKTYRSPVYRLKPEVAERESPNSS